jgi:hypothetical protein
MRFQNKFLKNSSCLIQSDNKTVIAYLRNEGGTKSWSLLQMTFLILQWVDRHNIKLQMNYLPGRYNGLADHLSRGKLLPEWHLSAKVTENIFVKWGRSTVDLFASATAHVVEQYVSIDINDRNAQFHNAFSRIWNFPLAWVFPPPCLIPRVLTHLNQSQGIYLLVAPKWHKVFWKPDLESRALCPPITIHHLSDNLIDTTTGLHPPQVQELELQVGMTGAGMTH